jgi:hypothetical protein
MPAINPFLVIRNLWSGSDTLINKLYTNIGMDWKCLLRLKNPIHPGLPCSFTAIACGIGRWQVALEMAVGMWRWQLAVALASGGWLAV